MYIYIIMYLSVIYKYVCRIKLYIFDFYIVFNNIMVFWIEGYEFWFWYGFDYDF